MKKYIEVKTFNERCAQRFDPVITAEIEAVASGVPGKAVSKKRVKKACKEARDNILGSLVKETGEYGGSLPLEVITDVVENAFDALLKNLK